MDFWIWLAIIASVVLFAVGVAFIVLLFSAFWSLDIDLNDSWEDDEDI